MANRGVHVYMVGKLKRQNKSNQKLSKACWLKKMEKRYDRKRNWSIRDKEEKLFKNSGKL